MIDIGFIVEVVVQDTEILEIVWRDCTAGIVREALIALRCTVLSAIEVLRMKVQAYSFVIKPICLHCEFLDLGSLS